MPLLYAKSYDDLRARFRTDIQSLRKEVDLLSEVFANGSLFHAGNHFSTAHYGYMVMSMARVDLWSRLWKGPNDQTRRIKAFLKTFGDLSDEHCELLVKMCRHLPAHTGEFRFVTRGDRAYTWRFHWANSLDASLHMTITEETDNHQECIWDHLQDIGKNPKHFRAYAINLRLDMFVRDLERYLERFLSRLEREVPLPVLIERQRFLFMQAAG